MIYKWQALAKCKDLPVDTFFETYEKEDKKGKRKILDICILCEVREECRQEGLSNQMVGVWGGTFIEMGKVIRNPLGRSYLEDSRDQQAREKHLALTKG
jgi:hypothetical protein